MLRKQTAPIFWLSLTLFGAALAATPTKQQAIVQTGYGGPEVLKLQTVPVRQPAEGQVLIKVYAASVNPADWKVRQGMVRTAGSSDDSDVSIPGLDAAGVVEKVGPGVTTIKIGDPVFAYFARGVSGLNGGYSQYVLAPATGVAAKPKRMTYTEAAGLGTAGVTGARMVAVTNVTSGQRVLITGIAGGVGSMAAQVAKARGAYVIGTASARHNQYLRSIGVDEVIDYTQGDWTSKVKDIDIALDTVGGATAKQAMQTMKKGGTFNTVAQGVAADWCTAAGVNCGGAKAPSTDELMAELARLVDERKLRVNVERTYPLEQAGNAQEHNRQGHTQGKIILIVDAANAGNR